MNKEQLVKLMRDMHAAQIEDIDEQGEFQRGVGVGLFVMAQEVTAALGGHAIVPVEQAEEIQTLRTRIAELEAELEHEKKFSKARHEISKAKSGCIDALLEANQQSGWVSVEDRLPENSNEVLAYCGFESQAWEFWLCAYIDGGWFSGTDNINVTHWMPLPAPPEGE